MALEDIKKSILANAEAEAEKIEADGQAKVIEIKNNWQNKIEQKKLEIINSAKRKAAQKIQQTQFKLQSKAQSEILKEKHLIIDKIYKTALKKISELSDDRYTALMEKLIKILPDGNGKLLSAKNKENLLKKALKNSGKRYEINTNSIPEAGGFKFQSEQIEINNTFPALINNSKEQTVLEVSRLLFSKIND